MINRKSINVDFFETLPRASMAYQARLGASLFRYAQKMVQKLNMEVGSEILYLVSYADVWILYGRPSETAVDRALLYGITEVDSLIKLVSKLEEFLQAGA